MLWKIDCAWADSTWLVVSRNAKIAPKQNELKINRHSVLWLTPQLTYKRCLVDKSKNWFLYSYSSFCICSSYVIKIKTLVCTVSWPVFLVTLLSVSIVILNTFFSYAHTFIMTHQLETVAKHLRLHTWVITTNFRVSRPKSWTASNEHVFSFYHPFKLIENVLFFNS